LQKKELEAELANVSGIAKPTRKIRYPFNNIIIMPFVMKNTSGIIRVQIIGLQFYTTI
jgi:hypothetical protein